MSQIQNSGQRDDTFALARVRLESIGEKFARATLLQTVEIDKGAKAPSHLLEMLNENKPVGVFIPAGSALRLAEAGFGEGSSVLVRLMANKDAEHAVSQPFWGVCAPHEKVGASSERVVTVLKETAKELINRWKAVDETRADSEAAKATSDLVAALKMDGAGLPGADSALGRLRKRIESLEDAANSRELMMSAAEELEKLLND